MKSLKNRQWEVAVRTGHAADGAPTADAEFTVVKNPWWGWAADPFFFEDGGTTYLFAEIYSFIKQKGCLGYCTLKNGRFSGWKKAIEEPHHLSYPFIWRDEKGIFICPESFMDRKISIYKAVDFPNKWVKDSVIADGCTLSDTTFIDKGGVKYGLTFDHMKKPPQLLLFRMKDGRAEFAGEPVSTDNSLARPGGRIYPSSIGDIRVGQNGVGNYGSGLAFLKTVIDYPNLREELLERWSAADVRLDKRPGDMRGIHTYNRLGDNETVDILFYKTSLLDVVGRILRGVRGRLKR